MRVEKGEAGYIRARKTILVIENIVCFVLVAALVITGYILNHTKLNLWTFFAILVCLPACRALVNLIMLAPYESINEARELEVSGKTESLTMLYELVITSERKAMPIDILAIYNNTVCGYTRNKKVDTAYAGEHIKSILAKNKLDKITVKIFQDYKAFLSRAEGMNNIATIEQNHQNRRNEDIRKILLDISL